MDLGLEGKTALITGASAGIGLSICRELAQNGVNLLMVARDKNRLKQAADSVRAQFNRTITEIAGDVTDPDFPARIGQIAEENRLNIDMLINNAGRAHAGTLLTTSDAEWEEMTAVKLGAMRRFCQAFIPGMMGRGWGRVVNISSIGGIYPNPQLTVSHALSAAINNLTRSLALDVAPKGVLVNAIGVGAVVTENWADNMIPNVRMRRPELSAKTDGEIIAILRREKTPVGRFGEPEDIAAIAAFLLSNRNQFITGHTIEASGGAERFM